jgi:protein phosphatase
MKTSRIAYFSVSSKKHSNQDSYGHYVLPNGETILAIADGVGGSSDGKLSSSTAIDIVTKWSAMPSRTFKEPFAEIDEKLKKLVIESQAKLTSLATTLTISKIVDNTLTFAHVGDCRIYLLRNNGIKTLTKDQTEAQNLLDQGILTKRRLRDYKRANVIISALGSSSFIVEEGEIALLKGDRVLLCSDGLYKEIQKIEIVNLSLKEVSIEGFSAALKSALINSPPNDDATAILYEH